MYMYILIILNHANLVLILYLSNKSIFLCLNYHIQTSGKLGEFEAIMQTQDTVKGLHNFHKFTWIIAFIVTSI